MKLFKYIKYIVFDYSEQCVQHDIIKFDWLE